MRGGYLRNKTKQTNKQTKNTCIILPLIALPSYDSSEHSGAKPSCIGLSCTKLAEDSLLHVRGVATMKAPECDSTSAD